MSDATVVAASRAFVCVRLATYENQKEADFLQTVFRGRMGTLENTTFALMAPDGKTLLTRSGRGPGWLIGERRGPDVIPSDGAQERLADVMTKTAKKYRAKSKPSSLPVSLDFRRALNVASCDSRPLVVALSSKDPAKLEKRLATLAWSDDLIGRYHYQVVSDRKALASIKGVPAGDRVLVIQPGRFGLDGTVVASAKAGASDKALAVLLTGALDKVQLPNKERRPHVRAGKRAGVDWEPEIPNTDPGPARPRRRR